MIWTKEIEISLSQVSRIVQLINSKDDDLSAIGPIIEELREALHDPCLINVNWECVWTGDYLLKYICLYHHYNFQYAFLSS